MYKLINALLFIIGASLLLINIYGLTQDIRPRYIFADELRFADDEAVDYETTLARLERLPNENDAVFTKRMVQVVDDGIAHIHWLRYDVHKFNQQVPIWENYLLYLVGLLTDIPEYQRYHFADYKRSLARGIGVCGDASMVLSQVLQANGIANKIVSFPGHVVVEAEVEGEKVTLDADFGVTLSVQASSLKNSRSLVKQAYLSAGYSVYDVVVLNNAYKDKYQYWDGVKHFITKKYYFEYISYLLKWFIPVLLLIISLIMFFRKYKDRFNFTK